MTTPAADRDTRPLFTYTGRKLGTAVLCYVLAVIGVITLEPFDFHIPSTVSVMIWDNWFDPLANIALFVPAGFVYALTRAATEPDVLAPSARRRLLWRTLLLGTLVSTGIELTQVFEPTRYPSPTDVTSNAAGALLGAWLYLRAARRLRADTPLVGRLALELPLMGLVYVLVPLCSLAALTVHGGMTAEAARWHPYALGLVALAAFGGTILGHVQRRHFGPAGVLSPAQAALVAAAWLGVGALPAIATAPIVFATSVLVAALAAWTFGRAPAGVLAINRRFESATLARATPWLVAFIALLALGQSGATTEWLGKVDLLRRVESLAAFTVLGYVLAEAWGRLELRYRFTAWRVGLVALVAALASELLRHTAAPSLDWVPSLVAHVVAAAYGGWLYHLQRAHVRALVAARTPDSDAHDTTREMRRAG